LLRNTAKKKVKRVSRAIVVGHLEKVSSRVFDQYRKQITELIKGNYGVYALYRREKLYYIGLATDFRRRLNQHLKDRHKGKWTHFSLYLIRKVDHIREIESLLLRIADPTGNYVRGKLKGSRDLRPKLKQLLTADFKMVIDEILGTRRVRRKVKKERKAAGGAGRPLKGLLRNGQGIYGKYKGKTYHAVVYSSGIIRFSGKTYDTPSGAGRAVLDKGAVNGWNFWKYKDRGGKLQAISNLRK
jgi:hypothetical protein